jgi:putative spermidine/putrescine transport system substrate-binding protein
VQPLLEGVPAVVVELMWEVRQEGPGTVVWADAGGEWHTAERAAFMDEWEQITGWTITPVAPATAIYPLVEEQVNSGAVEWDVVELGAFGTAIRAEEAGLLEMVDHTYFPVDYMPSTSRVSELSMDFAPYGTVLVYNTEVFGDNPPTSALDLFDTENFPGKRCIYDYPLWTLEWALLADGVGTLEEAYELLATEEGQARAFAKLDTIKDDIVYWASGAESVQFILDGQCDIGMTWNGRPASRVKEEPELPLAIVWDDAFLDGSSFGIVRGAPNAKAAMSAWAFGTTPQNECDLINEITYGIRFDVAPFPDCLTEFAAVWGAADTSVLAGTTDPQFWAAHEGALAERWTTWKTE